MKTFKNFIKEMNLDKVEPDYKNIEDRRGEKPNFKAGDRWTSGSQKQMGKTVTQKQADAINSGKMGGGSPFPKSWDKSLNDFKTSKNMNDRTVEKSTQPKTTNSTPPKQQKTVDSTPAPQNKSKISVNDSSTWPKNVDINKTSFATRADDNSSIKPGFANPEWIKLHPWAKKSQ